MKKIVLLAIWTAAALHAAEISGPEISPARAGMDPARLTRIAQRMREFTEAGTAAGIVTLVGRHGAVAGVSVSGYADLESKAPMRQDTIFRIMSMTKPMTGTALMMLVDEGRVSIIDPVEKYLPEFRDLKVGPGGLKPAHLITIQEVLSHTSGISGLPKGAQPRTLAEAVAGYARQPLDFQPGSSWRYRSEGIDTAGRIVEVVAGMPYEEFMADRIFHPLGMKDTSFFPNAEAAARVAAVYTATDGKLKRVEKSLPARGETFAAPGSGAFSTAADMGRFYQMILNHGALNGRRYLSAAAVDLMTSVQTGEQNVGFAPGMGYGLGWGVVKEQRGTFRYCSMGSFGHGGAYRTYGWVDPAKDMFTVLMMQRTNGGGDVADEINAFLAMAGAAIQQ